MEVIIQDTQEIIKDKLFINNPDYKENYKEEVISCLKELKLNKSIINLIINFINKLKMNLKEIKEFLNWFGERQTRRNQYDLTFYCVWISLLIYQKFQENKKEIQLQKCFNYVSEFISKKDLSLCIKNILQAFKKETIKQDSLNEFFLQIQEDFFYQNLISIWRQLAQMEQDYSQMPQQSYFKICQKNLIISFKNKFLYLNNGRKQSLLVRQLKEKLREYNVLSQIIQKDLLFIQKYQNQKINYVNIGQSLQNFNINESE